MNIRKIKSEPETILKKKLTFEESQKTLRRQLLDSKPNENLKSSILQELYIKGLVNQLDKKILFNLNFDLHRFDCGAPDCYSTVISFDIPVKKPIEFPERIDFIIKEHGCGIENEIIKSGTFERVEQDLDYVNYYSKKQKSNLVIIGNKRKLYYFVDQELGDIKVDSIEKMFTEHYQKDIENIAPYQSTIITNKVYKNW